LRRLGPDEYRNLAVALLHGRGKTGPLPPGFRVPFGEAAAAQDRYAAYASTATIGDAQLADVLDMNELLATAVVEKVDVAPGSCLRAGAFVDCARATIRAVAEIAFRRPPDAVEEAAFLKVAEESLSERGPKGSLALAVRAIVSSPDALFHVELGRARGPSGPALDAYEVADALASALSSAPPDELLWQAARRGELSSVEQLRPHVVRLLGDLTRAPPALMRFVRELFGYRKVLDVFQEEKLHAPDALIADTDALVADVIAKNGRAGFFASLLSTRATYVSAATALSYGLDARTVTAKVPARQEGLAQRVGLLTQPSFLAANAETGETAPVKRGLFVREEILCQAVPALPIGVVPVLPAGPMTARERLAIHASRPDCAACHKLMDGYGLAFETYDHLGRARTLDHGKAIDSAGVLDGSIDRDGPYKDALDLIGRLAPSQGVATCMNQQLFRFVAARPDYAGDACAVAQMTASYAKAQGDVVEAIVMAFAADSFRARLGK
jgi:hypothetical protein